MTWTRSPFQTQFIHVIYRYSKRKTLGHLECTKTFVASFGEISILAVGFKVRSLEDFTKQRKMCFVVFVDRNFYVIAGIGKTELSKVLLTHYGDYYYLKQEN
uniref:Uncharacterized protein n=1 Tax=Solanum lycopersicum TaxID=4081 RepID=A0A3Q7GN85_SOLLC